MQKLLKNINKIKERANQIEIHGSTPILTIDNQSLDMKKAYLSSNDIIKVAKIKLTGTITSIYTNISNGVHLKYVNNTIIITNFNKHIFNNNLLFYFTGDIINIASGSVTFWSLIVSSACPTQLVKLFAALPI